jgi:glycosyltransferase involved in cell wall biosynthesis
MNPPFGEALNQDRLALLYDPAYVRRIGPISDAPIQVCIDGRLLDAKTGTGVVTYTQVLAGCLPQAGAAPAVLGDASTAGAAPRARMRRWLSALDRQPRAARDAPGQALADGASGWVVEDLFREAQVFFNLHGRLLPVACSRPPAVMHWTYPTPLFMEGARNLYTVHDLIPLTDPALTAIPRARHDRLLRRVLERADLVVTVSETMRMAIRDHFALEDAFVVNTYQAVRAPLQTDPSLPAGLRPGRYFLFCGTVEPRKNLERLAQAHRLSGVADPLVVVGPAAPGQERLEAALRASPGVRRLPWLPRSELLGLMRGARALLFPSLAEGFGLPIAEAMTLGCPVMTSARGAPAEVAAGAAHLVDPGDVAAMAEAIGQLARDDGLCARLRDAGFARAQMFSAPAYVGRLKALYAQALAQPLRQGEDGEPS